MNVNQKGVSGLIKVIDDLQEKGLYTFPAFDDHSPVDIIALTNEGETLKIQIKYRESDYELRTSSVVNGKRVEIDRNMIDGWAIYLANEKKVVYIHKSDMEGKKSLLVNSEKDYGDIGEWAGR